jgi:hypothetical protein
MGYPTPSGEIQAVLTDQALQLMARAFNGELAYKLVGFSVGTFGYNTSDPTQVLPIDPLDLSLREQVYPAATGSTPFESIEQNTPRTLILNCRLPSNPVPSNADYGLGEVGIWAQVTWSTNPPPNANDVFLAAIAHMPIRCKTRRDVMLFRVVLSLGS